MAQLQTVTAQAAGVGVSNGCIEYTGKARGKSPPMPSQQLELASSHEIRGAFVPRAGRRILALTHRVLPNRPMESLGRPDAP
jgi:hypothetical protein